MEFVNQESRGTGAKAMDNVFNPKTKASFY
jgi:hypothetical protein